MMRLENNSKQTASPVTLGTENFQAHPSKALDLLDALCMPGSCLDALVVASGKGVHRIHASFYAQIPYVGLCTFIALSDAC